jgi:hypothetical protein
MLRVPGASVWPASAPNTSVTASHVRINDLHPVFDGWDFTGRAIYCPTGPGTSLTLTNCKLGPIPGGNAPWAGQVQTAGGVALMIKNCEIFSDFDSYGQYCLTYPVNGGGIVFQYNYVHDWSGGPQIGGVVASGDAHVDIRFNVFANNGLVGSRQSGIASNHLNLLQWNGPGTFSCVANFNTIIQQLNACGGQLWQFYDNYSGGRMSSADCSYNTVVTLQSLNPLYRAKATRQSSRTYLPGDVITLPSTPHYYWFCTVAGTSAAIKPPEYASVYAIKSIGAVADGTAVFAGNYSAMSYLYDLGNGDYSGNMVFLSTPTCRFNYFDLSGTKSAINDYGAFYPRSTNDWAVDRNVDMRNGRVIQS